MQVIPALLAPAVSASTCASAAQSMVSTPCAGLLLSAIRDPDPVVFFEAKMLYRTVSEEVPSGEYTIPLGEARVARTGSDITLVGWGQQVAVLERAVSCCCQALQQESPLVGLEQHLAISLLSQCKQA